MEFRIIECPACGGNLEIEDGLDTFYCKYCGRKTILDGQSNAAYCAKTRIKVLEHDERMADKEYAHKRFKMEAKREKDRREDRNFLIYAAIFILLFAVFFGGAKFSSDKQERELSQLVTEIQIDIDNGDYSSAYIKAQSIKYTAGWSDDIEKKWDNTRREVIDQIIATEIKATGSSTHEPEKSGLFGWFK